MHTVPVPDEAEIPLLRLHHDGGLPDARQTGLILDRLSNAFHGHSRLGTRDYRFAADLVIQSIEAGSLVVVFRDMLETASALLTAYEHRELLGGFVAQLNDALTLMRERTSSPLPMYRTTLEALSAPIRTKKATRLTLNVIGDNNRILILDSENVAVIQAFLNAQPRPLRPTQEVPTRSPRKRPKKRNREG